MNLLEGILQAFEKFLLYENEQYMMSKLIDFLLKGPVQLLYIWELFATNPDSFSANISDSR